MLFVQKEKIDFLEKFTELAKETTDQVLNSLEGIDREKEAVKFVSYFSTYSRISERLLKIYKILTSQEVEGLTEAIEIEPDIKNKINNIISLSREGAVGGFERFMQGEEKVLEKPLRIKRCILNQLNYTTIKFPNG